MAPKLIALEEHFDTGLFPSDILHDNLPSHVMSKLHDIDSGRVQDLDNGKCSLQILSHVGGPTPTKETVESNDRLAAACKKHPTRLAGWANLPMQDPAAAVHELERCVRQLGFVGALLNNHAGDGQMYDEEKFWPVFEKAVELDVPIYIHPTYPADNLENHYNGNFGMVAGIMMSTAGWGWHSETGLHFLRLFAAGLFDRLPKLKLIIGHMGELLPHMLDRIIHGSRNWAKADGSKYQRDLRTVWKENLWVTTSGMFTLPPLRCLLEYSHKSHVMFSVDYPFSTTEMGLEFVELIEREGLLRGDELDGFCFRNAEELLQVKAVDL
jgi:predicted TIM-barrel fold metal-dependent hydrolase